MAKKNFDPFILLLMPTPEPTTVIGGGTGQSTTDPYPCSFSDWQTLFGEDLDGNDKLEMNDYMIWFQSNIDQNIPGFDLSAWSAFNPGVPLEPDFGG